MLPVGASVYTKESGVPVEYIVVQQGNPDTTMYDASCDGTWVLRKDCYNSGKWNNSNVNTYANSTINTWLNNDFVSALNIKDVIKQVKIPYCVGNASSTINSGVNGLSTKAFLIGMYEVGLTNSNHESIPEDGVKLSYFENGMGTSAKNKRISYLNASASTWYTRSPYIHVATNIWAIKADGGYDNGSISARTDGVRPCFIIPSDTEVDELGNIVV